MAEQDGPNKRVKLCPLHVPTWVRENEGSFLPPVCNKLMYGAGQLKVMFIGGPNIRADFHIEEGEELFYMLKGDMVLKVMEKGEPKDIPIKEGEVFVLPSRIPHSPQRFEGTIGLVIERERLETETDGLRYYRPDAPKEPLYEEWFHCHDLGSQLKPVIDRFFASEQHKTGKPIAGTLADPTPVKIDVGTDTAAPFSLESWMQDNDEAIGTSGSQTLWKASEFEVIMHGDAEPFKVTAQAGEIWLWQLTGESEAEIDGQLVFLGTHDCILVPQGSKLAWTQQTGARGMSTVMNPPKQ